MNKNNLNNPNIPKEFREIFPTTCPECGANLVFDGVHLVCSDLENCSGIKRLMFHQGVHQLGLFGVGASMIDAIYDSGFRKATDLLNPIKFNKQALLEKGIIKDGKLVDNLFNELEKISEISIHQILLMMGFQGMGHTTAVQIANKIAGLPYDFSGLEKSVVDGYDEGQPKRNAVDEVISELMQFVNIKLPEDNSKKIGIEMTGSTKDTPFATKDEFLTVAKEYGFIHTKIKDAKILVTNDISSNSGKMKIAAKINKEKPGTIEIITYNDFIKKYCKKHIHLLNENTVNSNNSKTKSLF